MKKTKKCQNCPRLRKWETTKLHLQKRISFLEKENVIDFLTGVYNRKEITRFINDEIEKIRRYGEPFSFCIILIDIDNLKNFNDFSFLLGDYIIKSIAKSISEQARKTEKVGRIGGDEFVILCPQTKILRATKITERLRKTISSKSIEYEGRYFQISISLGLMEVKNKRESISGILEKLDIALKNSKRNGKDKTTTVLTVF